MKQRGLAGWGRCLGFGLILCMGVAAGMELQPFTYQVGDPQATRLVFTFDATVAYEAVERDLDVIIRVPENVDLQQFPPLISLDDSIHVREVRVRPDRQEIVIRRRGLLPYEIHVNQNQIAIWVFTPTESAISGASSNLGSNTGANPGAKLNSAKLNSNRDVGFAPKPPKPSRIHTVRMEIPEPASRRDTVEVHLEGTLEAGTKWKVFSLGTERPHQIRWVIDWQPMIFDAVYWRAEASPVAWLYTVRLAQFQGLPSPVVRLVLEVKADVPEPQIQATDSKIIVRLRLPGALAEDEKPAPDDQQPQAAHRLEEPRRQAPQPADAQAPHMVPETPKGESPPESPPGASVAPRAPGPTAPRRSEEVAEKWDSTFFDTRDMAFYQAGRAETHEAEEAARRSRELAIFRERRITATKKYEGAPISMDFTDVHIRDLMLVFSDISGLNIVLDPKVEGEEYRIPLLRLEDVPWDQALDLVTRMLGLGYVLEGNVLRIAPVEDLQQEQERRRQLEEQIGALQTVIKPLSYADAGKVRDLATHLLSPRGEIFVDERTNTLIIKETETNIQNILNLVDTLDTPIPQVNIEVRIVETRRTFTQQLGIQWGFRGLMTPEFGNTTSLVFPNNIQVLGNVIQPQTGIVGNPLQGYAINLPTLQAPTGAMLLSFGSVMDTFRLDMALMALESVGLARVLSSPRISTQNNQTADIQSGDQIPVQTIVNNTIQVQYVNATLRLQVTPQITADGSVIMKVRVENRRPDFSRLVLGIPPIITQEAETTLLVRDGATVVLGGIIRASQERVQARLPWIHKIPIIGWFFKNRNITQENNELLIFLTPHIVKTPSSLKSRPNPS